MSPIARKRTAIRSTRTQIAQFTRSDFLTAVQKGSLGKLVVITEKKKRELWAEPESGTSFGAVMKGITGEKKKYELEVPLGGFRGDPAAGPALRQLTRKFATRPRVGRRSATSARRRTR